MDFPALRPQPYLLTNTMTEALGEIPIEVYKNRDLIFLYYNEEQVRRLTLTLKR